MREVEAELMRFESWPMVERRRRTAWAERSPELRLTPVSPNGRAELTESG